VEYFKQFQFCVAICLGLIHCVEHIRVGAWIRPDVIQHSTRAFGCIGYWGCSDKRDRPLVVTRVLLPPPAGIHASRFPWRDSTQHVLDMTPTDTNRTYWNTEKERERDGSVDGKWKSGKLLSTGAIRFISSARSIICFSSLVVTVDGLVRHNIYIYIYIYIVYI